MRQITSAMPTSRYKSVSMSASAIWRKSENSPGPQKGYGIGRTVDTLLRHGRTSNDS